MAKYDPRNTLNDLTGSDWLTFTRTWFAAAADDGEVPAELAQVLRAYAEALLEAQGDDTLGDLEPADWLAQAQSWFLADSKRYWRNKGTELHPARFPEEMVERFLRFFTKAGMWVLDPFAGSGATLVSCAESGRHGVGIEINPTYAATMRERLSGQPSLFEAAPVSVVLEGDCRAAAAPGFWEPALAAGCPSAEGLPQFDFVICSPPYWNMLRTSRGGVFSTQKERAAKGLDTHYSDAGEDLGNLHDYDEFVEALGGVFDGLHPYLRAGRYLVIVIQNLRAPDGEVKPLAWDVARRVGRSYSFQGERIWCQNTKKLGIWGYPRIFVPNYHHHYCLIFRK